MGQENDKTIGEDCKETEKREKAKILIEKTKQYRDLAKTAQEVGRYFEGSAIAWWRHGNEEMVDWSERKGDHLYNITEYYKEEAVKSSNQLYTIIGTSEIHLEARIKLEKRCNGGKTPF